MTLLLLLLSLSLVSCGSNESIYGSYSYIDTSSPIGPLIEFDIYSDSKSTKIVSGIVQLGEISPEKQKDYAEIRKSIGTSSRNGSWSYEGSKLSIYSEKDDEKNLDYSFEIERIKRHSITTKVVYVGEHLPEKILLGKEITFDVGRSKDGKTPIHIHKNNSNRSPLQFWH